MIAKQPTIKSVFTQIVLIACFKISNSNWNRNELELENQFAKDSFKS